MCRVPYGPGEHSHLIHRRSPVCCADGHRCVTLAHASFCSGWPSPVPARVNAAAVVNRTITQSLSLSDVLPHTYTQANKLRVSWDTDLHLWTRRKTNRHQKATYGLLLMGHISWALTDTVSQMAQWLRCFAPLFELKVELLAAIKSLTIFPPPFSQILSWALLLYLLRMEWLSSLPALNPKDNWKINSAAHRITKLLYLCM